MVGWLAGWLAGCVCAGWLAGWLPTQTDPKATLNPLNTPKTRLSKVSAQKTQPKPVQRNSWLGCRSSANIGEDWLAPAVFVQVAPHVMSLHLWGSGAATTVLLGASVIIPERVELQRLLTPNAEASRSLFERSWCEPCRFAIV